MRIRFAGALLVLLVTLYLAMQVRSAPLEQTAPTASPAVINSGDLALQQAAQLPVGNVTATWTATAAPPAVAQVTDQVNVRAEPSTDAAILGVIRPGEAYNITGRWFEWVQIQYVASPNGRGWVFGQLVTIVGEEAAIPNIDLNAQPTLDATLIGATETMEIITLTPGGLLTATALSREIALPGAAGQGESAILSEGVMLPTFTYPSGVVLAPTQAADSTTLAPRAQGSRIGDEPGGIPPIVPIMLLGGLGMLGLAVGSLRRGNG